MRIVFGVPDFNNEAFGGIKNRVEQSSDTIICNICIDEMAIRKQVSFLSRKFYGGVDLDTGCDNETDNVDTSALVILAVYVNGHWKVLLGYL